MSSKKESSELEQRVLDFLCNEIEKFLFIDCSSSQLNRKEIFDVIRRLPIHKGTKNSAKTLRNYQGSKNQAYYKWNHENFEEIMSKSPNLLVLEVAEEEEIDKDRVKKILDLANGYLWKKTILVSRKEDIFNDLVYWYIKAGMLKLNKTKPDFLPIHNIVLRTANALEDIKDLICEGADINQQNENRDTPLHLAVENGHADLVHHLLGLGADINLKNQEDQTVLHVALEKAFFDIANIILTENANVNLKDKEGCTALHLAAKLGNVDIMKKLIEKGADINTKSTDNCTPLMYACKGGKDAVEYLLPLVKDVDIQETLMAAVKTDNGDVISILVNSGADVNFRNWKWLLPPLFEAIAYGNLNTVNVLLNHGADPNYFDTFHGTPLYKAVLNGHNEIVQTLLKAGSRLDTPYRHRDIIHVAVKTADKDTLLALLKNNSDVALKKDTSGNTALHHAILNDCTDVIDVIIAQGIDINATNVKRQTALFLACESNRLDAVRCLISHRADVNVKERKSKRSPLHVACKNGHLDVVRALLDAGANINDVKKSQETALHIAARKGHKDIVVELIERGGDVTAVNARGQSVLDIGRKRLPKKILEILSKDN